MADEIKAGDTLSYTAFGLTAPASAGGSWQFLAQCIADKINGNGVDVTGVSGGSWSFSIQMRSRMDRASSSDIKGDIDSILAGGTGGRGGTCPADAGWSSTLNKVGGGVLPSNGSGGNQQPPAPKPQSDFLAQLAAQMGVPKDTLIWGAAGLALFLFLKK